VLPVFFWHPLIFDFSRFPLIPVVPLFWLSPLPAASVNSLPPPFGVFPPLIVFALPLIFEAGFFSPLL